MEQVFANSATRMHVSGNKGLIVPAVAGQDRGHVIPARARPPRQAPRLRGCPHSLYLLIDRDEKRVILFSGPVRDEYVSTSSVPFGDSLELPAPFSFTLETDGLAT